jgi:hypothetical protein
MTVEPFGKVHYWDRPDGSGRMIRATILLGPQIKGAKMGLAIDGSRPMEDLFGEKLLEARLPSPSNHVRVAAARAMGTYLAKRSADHKVTVAYWATGPDGQDIQGLGDLAWSEAEKFDFGPPDHYGTSRQLLPALKYFTDGQQRKDLYDALLGIYTFITSGAIEDMDAVKQYCTQLASDIDAGRRNDLKLIILGLGSRVDQDQLDELGDLVPGADVDLWDATLVPGTRDEVMAWFVPEIKHAVVEGTILVPRDGIIRDGMGTVVVDYRDSGLPDVLEFVLPPCARSFSLEFVGHTAAQPLP